jgi:hypothetical protein
MRVWNVNGSRVRYRSDIEKDVGGRRLHSRRDFHLVVMRCWDR